MMCDVLLAAPSAKFGQPEINLGVIPGAGGTQRLTRLVGRSRAMELILTGKTFGADEAERWGVVSRVVREGSVVDEAVKVAAEIAGKGRLSVLAAKEAVNAGMSLACYYQLLDKRALICSFLFFSFRKAYELPLSEGLRLERRLFHSLFATEDQKEGGYFMLSFSIHTLCFIDRLRLCIGMSAFAEKRKPNFSHL